MLAILKQLALKAWPQFIFFCSTTSRPWITTGMFPQFFVITFPDLMQIQSIKISAKYGKNF